MKVIISGGGSGGHVFPAIAIANELRRRDENADILFVGANDKIEMEKVPMAGYEIRGLWISGWHRKQLLRNILFPIKLISSLVKSYLIVRRFRPDVVIGVGGFASGPILAVAARKQIPTLVQEQNYYPGKTNLLLAESVDKICVAYPDMERFFPQDKIVITGNPVRVELKRMTSNKNEALEYFNLSESKKTLFVFGGSLGAKSINKAIAHMIGDGGLMPSIQMIWQIGKLYWDNYKDDEFDGSIITKRPFIDRMDLAYEAADLIICRAGALTISELSYLGKAAILVPSPNVAEDHQSKNAEALADYQAVEIIRDENLDDELRPRMERLIHDEPRLEMLRDNIKRMAKPKAIDLIADEILKLVA